MTLVIGVGNPDRGDDAAGLAVARALRQAGAHAEVTELTGDQLGLLDLWRGAREAGVSVVVVDAAWSGAPPGTVHEFTAAAPLGHAFHHTGTHTFSLADVIELARHLGALPRYLRGYGIEAASFGFGQPLSPAVAEAVRVVAAKLTAELVPAT